MGYTANYRVTRPAAARVINEDNYNTGIVRYYVNNGSVVFIEGESYSTIWPGIDLQHYSNHSMVLHSTNTQH